MAGRGSSERRAQQQHEGSDREERRMGPGHGEEPGGKNGVAAGRRTGRRVRGGEGPTAWRRD